MSSLFRKEALEHRKDRLYGDVVLLQPLSISVLVGVSALICILIIGILFWGSFARKENVRGYIIPDKGVAKAYTPQPGTITHVHVIEGQQVNEGQTLITIVSEKSMQGGSDLDTRILAEISGSRQQMEARVQGEDTRFAMEKSRLQGQIKGLNQELSQLVQSLEVQRDRLKIAQDRINASRKLLDKKYMSESEFQKIYVEFLEQQQRYQDLERAKTSTQNNIAKTESELEQLPIMIAASKTDLSNKISELNRAATEVHGRRAIEIRAPVAGIVTGLQANIGQWQPTNMPILTIVPAACEFKVELFVPSKAIGFIQKDQKVRIRYDAFPYQRFGIYQGSVRSISKHVLNPNELPIPLDLKEPVYRITVDLDQQMVQAYGQAFPLQAGMMLDADIVLDQQTLIEWIFEPLISLKGRF